MANSDGDQGGGGATRKQVGRPPKLDATALAMVERLAREHPHDTLGELADRVAAVTGIRVSQQSLRLRLREMGFERVVPPRVRQAEPGLTSEAPLTPVRYGYAALHREQPGEAPHLHGFGDGEWEVIADLFVDKVRGVERKYPRRLMLDAMAYVVRGGIPWRMLPAEFPPWHLVYKTFHRWSRQGRFERMYDRLRGLWRSREGRAPEPTAAVIDSPSVKTSAQGGPKGFDGAKKVKGRKRHLLTDTL